MKTNELRYYKVINTADGQLWYMSQAPYDMKEFLWKYPNTNVIRISKAAYNIYLKNLFGYDVNKPSRKFKWPK